MAPIVAAATHQTPPPPVPSPRHSRPCGHHREGRSRAPLRTALASQPSISWRKDDGAAAVALARAEPPRRAGPPPRGALPRTTTRRRPCAAARAAARATRPIPRGGRRPGAPRRRRARRRVPDVGPASDAPRDASNAGARGARGTRVSCVRGHGNVWGEKGRCRALAIAAFGRPTRRRRRDGPRSRGAGNRWQCAFVRIETRWLPR